MTAKPAAGRKLPCDPVAQASRAEAVRLPGGRVAFEPMPGAYAGIPAWHSEKAWLGAIEAHPRLLEACARRLKPGLFLAIMRELAGRADPSTGRGISAIYTDIAESLGICTKTVQRACRIAGSLGALHLVLAGSEMSLGQRCVVLATYRRGDPRRQWRRLPNTYAATMPAELAALAPTKPAPIEPAGVVQPVDGSERPDAIVQLPEGNNAPLLSSVNSTKVSSFRSGCGQPADPAEAETGQAAAGRPPQKRHRRANRAGPRLEPELAAYAEALRARLLGFRGLSIARVGPALRRYHKDGLTPADLTAGLDGYTRAHGLTWITEWEPRDREGQARYLVAMLTRARLAGHLGPAAAT